MKKMLKTLVLAVVILPIAFVMVACGGSGSGDTYKFSSLKITSGAQTATYNSLKEVKAYEKGLLIEDTTATELSYAKDILGTLISHAYLSWQVVEVVSGGVTSYSTVANAILARFGSTDACYAISEYLIDNEDSGATTVEGLIAEIAATTTEDLVSMLTNPYDKVVTTGDDEGMAKLTEILDFIDLDKLVKLYDTYADRYVSYYYNRLLPANMTFNTKGKTLTVTTITGTSARAYNYDDIVKTVESKVTSGKFTKNSEGVITSDALEDALGVTMGVAKISGKTITMTVVYGALTMEFTYKK